MRPRLDPGRLAELPPAIERPRYDRNAVRPGIVHLGVGAFHRAHQAVAIDDCLGAGARDWGIIGVSLRSAETRDALAPQDGLYTVVARDSDIDRFRVVGSIQQLVVAPENPAALVAAMADPAIRIVSLTVTEKGYARRSGAELDEDHPDIRHDLAEPANPRSALGFLAAAIERRRASGVPPFTVLSCDNLPSNGATLRQLLVRFAELRSPELGDFVRDNVACPSTMVDRIVPATTDADRAMVAEALGVEDAWPIVTEPFFSWVIEDDFPLGRPDIPTPGARFVRDVEPFERMKLRLLNGAHSALAYGGLLLGHETVAEAFADPDARRLVETLWVENGATLPAETGMEAYCAELSARFANRALRHRLEQIATDGSEKLPQRIAQPLAENLASGRSIDAGLLVVALWLEALARVGRGEFAFTDPRLAELQRLAADPDEAAVALGALGRLGIADSSSCEPIAARLAGTLARLRHEGPRAAIRGLGS